MLRALDEHGGIAVYSENITRELLARDRQNQYVLIYRSPRHRGRFGTDPNVVERVVEGRSKALWDQLEMPRVCKQERIDVLFHPKFTVPLLAPCPTVMVLHGAGWFMPEFRRFWNRLDLIYVRMAMPIYCRRAAAVLAVSNITRETFERELGIPTGKIRTVYFAPARQFRRVSDDQRLRATREKYRLPERFILSLSGYTKGPRKNIGVLLDSYRRAHDRVGHKLVIVGKDCDRFREEYQIPDDGYGADVLFPGWIDQQDLPAVYSLADLFLYPSYVEAFPVPITEAMACGTPIVTSDANGLREIAGEAARFVDPRSAEAVSAAMVEVLDDDALRQRLSRQGLDRSQRYSWDTCAGSTLEALESAVAGS